MLARLIRRVRTLPDVAAWSELRRLLDHLDSPEIPPWDYPLLACEAAGGERSSAEPGAAAVLCLAASISLADDLLDGDPAAAIDCLGPGRAANAALALQAAAHQVLSASELPEPQREVSLQWAGRAALATSHGQDLDAGRCAGEEDYWRILEAKAVPLPAAAMALGGVAAGADGELQEGLAEVGAVLGKAIQLNDDLTDAMVGAAASDWERPRHNLALLYALTADHRDRGRFESLLGRLHEPGALEEARLILTRSGAISFVVYHLTRFYRQANERVRDLSLPSPRVLLDLVDRHAHPVEALLREAGLESPQELWTP